MNTFRCIKTPGDGGRLIPTLVDIAKSSPDIEALVLKQIEDLCVPARVDRIGVHARAAILNFYRALDKPIPAFFWSFVAFPPRKGEQEEWAEQTLTYLQEEGAVEVGSGLPGMLQLEVRCGLDTLIESQTFAAASSLARAAALQLYFTCGGSPATYIWETCCAQILERCLPENRAKVREHAIQSLRSAIESAVAGEATVASVVEHLKAAQANFKEQHRDTLKKGIGMAVATGKHPALFVQQWEDRTRTEQSYATLLPTLLEQINAKEDIVARVLAREKKRRPSALSVLYEVYEPTSGFWEEIVRGFSDPHEYDELVNKMDLSSKSEKKTEPLPWWEQFWIAWYALTSQPDEQRRDQLLQLFVRYGFPKAPGRYQQAIIDVFT